MNTDKDPLKRALKDTWLQKAPSDLSKNILQEIRSKGILPLEKKSLTVQPIPLLTPRKLLAVLAVLFFLGIYSAWSSLDALVMVSWNSKIITTMIASLDGLIHSISNINLIAVGASSIAILFLCMDGFLSNLSSKNATRSF